jgi:hypothetical protein
MQDGVYDADGADADAGLQQFTVELFYTRQPQVSQPDPSQAGDDVLGNHSLVLIEGFFLQGLLVVFQLAVQVVG